MTASNARTLQRGRIAGRFDSRHARIHAAHAQAARENSVDMLGIGVERSHLGNGRQGRGKQAADGTAPDNEDIRRHGFSIPSELYSDARSVASFLPARGWDDGCSSHASGVMAACPGHPRLCCQAVKTWMPATSAGMTGNAIRFDPRRPSAVARQNCRNRSRNPLKGEELARLVWPSCVRLRFCRALRGRRPESPTPLLHG